MHNSLCLLSFAFIGASLYTMFTCETCPPFINFKKSLSPDQIDLYQKIVKERFNIAAQGLGLGFAIGFLYLYIFKNSFDILTNSCAFTGITLLTQYFYYMLMPKQSMLPELDNQEKIEAWYDVYKFMQSRYHIGMIIGIIGYFILAYSVSCG